MCYLMCGVDLLRTCLSEMISTFTSEQTLCICRQRLGTFEQCPRSAAWTPAVRQPVKLQKEAIQASLATFSLCKPKGCGYINKGVYLEMIWRKMLLFLIQINQLEIKLGKILLIQHGISLISISFIFISKILFTVIIDMIN